MATNYPIILAHGIFMKPRLFRVFRYIQHGLSAAGYRVYVADTDGVGNTESNALMLSKQIDEILEKEKAEKINIIAHSKGGLESVHMIEHLDMGKKIASLTTICTPFRGSAVASFVNGLPGFLLSTFVFFTNAFYKILGDKNPDFRTAVKQLDLRDEYDKENVLASHGIYCQSYSSRMHKATSDPVLSISYLISTHHERDVSDGMVSNKSTRFAKYKGDCIEDSVSHNEIVCYLTRRSKKEKVLRFYISLCEELSQMGF